MAKLARDCGIKAKGRSLSPRNHVVAMLYTQLTHAIGLNDVCDALHRQVGWLARIRRASPPSRNGFSHANKERPTIMAERLFWKVLEHLRDLQPHFGSGRRFRGLPHRFKRVVHVVDSTRIQLIASCMDWAKRRRRKAAATLKISASCPPGVARILPLGRERQVEIDPRSQAGPPIEDLAEFPVGRPRIGGGLQHDEHALAQVRYDRLGGVEHERQVQLPIVGQRREHAEDDGVDSVQRSEVAGRAQAPAGEVGTELPPCFSRRAPW